MLTVTQVPNKPIVIMNLSQDQSAETRGVETLGELLAKQQQKVTLVMDMRNLPISIDTMIQNMNYDSHQTPLFAHPMLRETVVVTDSEMVELAMKGLASNAYGNRTQRGFHSMEDAEKCVDSQASVG